MAHRPQKKKTAPPAPGTEANNPELSDTLDERNLIDAAESASISFEDRLRIYWDENRTFISGCIVVLLLVVIGYQGLVLLRHNAERRLQNEFAAIAEDDLAAREAFARSRANSPLGGFAALTLADTFYEDGDFASAAEFYALAARGLEGNFLHGRALLGVAFSAMKQGDEASARQTLEGILANSQLAGASRAEAVFHLAILAHTENETQRFQTLSARLAELPQGAIWERRLSDFR